MRKSPAVKRMTKAGRQVRHLPSGDRAARRPVQPAPAHPSAQPIDWSDDPTPVPTDEQIDAHSEPYNDLYDKKVVDLRTMAKDAGVKGYSKMNKNDLVAALS